MADRLELEREYWNKAAQDPDVDIKYISDVSTEECLEALNGVDGGETLEIGCGVGRITNRLAQRQCWGIYGIDISQSMLEIATERSYWKHGTTYKLTDGRSIPFEANKFSGVYSVLLFQHLEPASVHDYILETSRVLKPGGIFRFQFIEGIENEPFSQHHKLEDLQICLGTHGFKIDKTDQGLCHPQWTWITARKTND